MAQQASKRRKTDHGFEGVEPARQSQNQYGDLLVTGQARVHQGNNHGIHHHHYTSAHNNTGPPTDEDAFKVLRDSLLFDRWEDRIRNVAKPLPRTCGWLFNHKHFKSWTDPEKLNEHHGFLWIKGHPGCGKSTIMKHAVEWVKKKRKKDWNVISYFFNARAPGKLEKSSLGLYRSLVYQLLAMFTDSHQLFMEHFIFKSRDHVMSDWNITELQN